jgi:hypothetical protein
VTLALPPLLTGGLGVTLALPPLLTGGLGRDRFVVAPACGLDTVAGRAVAAGRLAGAGVDFVGAAPVFRLF